ncbi:MAG: SMP-30/gluconolactonase/LRE family protein [Prosthecobacter sp.]|uniref:SMP-30/gluconolactonase/LRE family protein n=1 Tax=Prosthecobacter sp. TaxID=1965333 RepID=UPI00262F6C58|nr:SMP-30/gluconolactonase/LRE family protein [Prosthecobacter sp.]MCF7789543.1 SMP-30/gluconolactonase/LRE family protein [Prosthecobacter sp.]
MTPEPITNHISVWGEGPIWHGDRLLYVDIETHKIIAFTPSTGQEQIWDVGQRVGTVVPRASGGLVWAGDNGFFFLDEATGISTPIADPEPDLPDNRFNDGKCDPSGRLWAGTICLQKHADAALYCLHTDHRVEKKFGPVTNSNGIIWSSDTRTMYYIDTPSKKIRAFDFDNATSAITNERVVWDTSADPSSPDGMTIDTEDRLWIAFCHGAKVGCFNPSTKQVEMQIDFPCVETTACAFGGPDLRDLYITTGKKPDLDEPLAGRLFVCRPGAQGVPSSMFGG